MSNSLYSHLQYCITSWGNAPTTLKPLTMIQNHVVRMIAIEPYLTTTTQTIKIK